MSDENLSRLKSAALWLAWLNFAVVAAHSAAHQILGVKATPAQLAFIVPVIIAGPVAAGLLLPRRGRAGAVVLLVSSIGAFFFGLYYHFVADTIDHVSHVARMEPALWSHVFRATAWLLLAAEALGALAAWAYLSARARPLKAKAYAARTSL